MAKRKQSRHSTKKAARRELVTAGATRALGYDGADDRGTGRRRDIAITRYHEDREASEHKRKILNANNRDLQRNFVVARWVLRKHLDYVTSFTFQAKTGNAQFDDQLENWMERRTRPENFDAARRHSMQSSLRIAEACRTLDGDVGWLRIIPPGPPGPMLGKIQGIEHDLIRTPASARSQDRWINGVLTDSAGAAEAYGLHSRRFNGGYDFLREVPARNLYLHGYFEDRYDQVRGVSPLAPALNWYRDTYEGLDYALAKLKVAQLFGLKIKRNATEGAWGDETPTVPSEPAPEGEEPVKDTGYEVNLNRGPFQLDLNPGDDADFLESATPATQTVEFLQLMIFVAIKALDVPASFFDESHTNFYGSRGGLIQYQKSCDRKIEDNQSLLRWWTDWAIGIAIQMGELIVPTDMPLSAIRYEWVRDGVKWWNPVQEAQGAAMGVAIGATSPQRIAREANTDFYDNIDQTAEAMAYAKSKGVPLTFADSTAFVPAIQVAGTP